MEIFLEFLTDSQRAELFARAERRRYHKDEVVLAEGERRRALFFVRAGVVRIERSHMGFNIEVSCLEAGELFGEMSFVEDFGASASVIADGPVEIDIIDEAHVRDLMEGDADFRARFYQSLALILSRRLRETTVRSLAEYSWGGYWREPGPRPRAQDAWGGGSPLRDLGAPQDGELEEEG